MSEVLGIINQKGGVAKTTTSVNLAAVLSPKGSKVLLVDIDPQANTTTGLGIDKTELRLSIWDILLDEYEISEAIISTIFKSLDIVPSNLSLSKVEKQSAGETAPEFALKRCLEDINAYYDLVIIDSSSPQHLED